MVEKGERYVVVPFFLVVGVRVVLNRCIVGGVAGESPSGVRLTTGGSAYQGVSDQRARAIVDGHHHAGIRESAVRQVVDHRAGDHVARVEGEVDVVGIARRDVHMAGVVTGYVAGYGIVLIILIDVTLVVCRAKEVLSGYETIELVRAGLVRDHVYPGSCADRLEIDLYVGQSDIRGVGHCAGNAMADPQLEVLRGGAGRADVDDGCLRAVHVSKDRIVVVPLVHIVALGTACIGSDVVLPRGKPGDLVGSGVVRVARGHVIAVQVVRVDRDIGQWAGRIVLDGALDVLARRQREVDVRARGARANKVEPRGPRRVHIARHRDVVVPLVDIGGGAVVVALCKYADHDGDVRKTGEAVRAACAGRRRILYPIEVAVHHDDRDVDQRCSAGVRHFPGDASGARSGYRGVHTAKGFEPGGFRTQSLAVGGGQGPRRSLGVERNAGVLVARRRCGHRRAGEQHHPEDHRHDGDAQHQQV